MAGCSLDFSVRPQPGDGGSPPDAGTDAGPSIDDAGTDADVPDATSADGGDAAVGDCKALKDDLVVKKKTAQTCQTTTAFCQTSVKNECGCDIFVGKSDSVATFEYIGAIDAFKAANCVNGAVCPGVCPATDAKQCLYYLGEPLCYPQ